MKRIILSLILITPLLFLMILIILVLLGKIGVIPKY